MPDREKVIEQIHDAIDYGICVDLFLDILALLKEQEEQIRIKTENFNRLVAKIEVMPEIVRCKDCKYCMPLGWDDWYGSCRYFNTHSVQADGFCNNGERRDADA